MRDDYVFLVFIFLNFFCIGLGGFKKEKKVVYGGGKNTKIIENEIKYKKEETMKKVDKKRKKKL